MFDGSQMTRVNKVLGCEVSVNLNLACWTTDHLQNRRIQIASSSFDHLKVLRSILTMSLASNIIVFQVLYSRFKIPKLKFSVQFYSYVYVVYGISKIVLRCSFNICRILFKLFDHQEVLCGCLYFHNIFFFIKRFL